MDVAKWGHRKYTGPEFQPDHLFGVREHELYTDYQDHFEYFGNTEIEWIGKKGKRPSGMTGSSSTPLTRPWNFSMIDAVSSWATTPMLLPGCRLLQ